MAPHIVFPVARRSLLLGPSCFKSRTSRLQVESLFLTLLLSFAACVLCGFFSLAASFFRINSERLAKTWKMQPKPRRSSETYPKVSVIEQFLQQVAAWISRFGPCLEDRSEWLLTGRKEPRRSIRGQMRVLLQPHIHSLKSLKEWKWMAWPTMF